MKNKLNVAVCDDDNAFLKQESDLLGEVLSQTGVDFEIDAFNEPDGIIGNGKKYDIVFLDVEMKTMTGIEAADAIHREYKNTLIFFVTNYEGYMDEALNKHAFRFWVKPLNYQRLLYGIESAIRELKAVKASLCIIASKQTLNIPVQDIIYVYAKDKRTCVVTTDGEFDVREPFKNILKRLDADCFCVPHASYCVNLAYVAGYTHSDVTLKHKDNRYTAYMSKRKYSEFSAGFMKWAGEHV